MTHHPSSMNKDIVKILKATKDEKQILVQLSKLIINPKE